MGLVAKRSENKNVKDQVFVMVKKARDAKQKYGAENVVDVTLGSLFGEDEKFVSFETANKVYKDLTTLDIATYAESFLGNLDFLTEIEKWVLGTHKDKYKVGVLATPGGSGSVSTTIKNTLDPNETLLIPDIGWSPYRLMGMEHGVEVASYSLFNSNDTFDLEDFEKQATKIMKAQKKVLAIINDPCHNPTGYSMTVGEWEAIVEIMNRLSKEYNGNFVLLNDIAYIDYAANGYQAGREYMKTFEKLSKDNLVVFAYSCSKTMTMYGLRVGASVVISSDQKNVDDYITANEFTARGLWSNVPKGGMKLFSHIYADKELKGKLNAERDVYIDLLKKRAEIFMTESKEVGLDIYPYKEGFFITIKMEDSKVVENLEKLNAENIYPIQVAKGIRIAICGSSCKKLTGLAKRIKEIIK